MNGNRSALPAGSATGPASTEVVVVPAIVLKTERFGGGFR